MADARITVEVGGYRAGALLKSVDMSASRHVLAIQIGNMIVDAIWKAMEDSK